MPYQSIWEVRGVLTTWTGVATGEELLDYIIEGQANPRFDRVTYAIHDFTACTGTKFSPASIEELAAMDSAGALTNDKIRIGVVADQAEVKSMVKDYLGTEMSPYPVRIFPTLEEAREWVENQQG